MAAAAFSGKPKNHALIQQHSREAIRAINNALSKKSAYEEDDAAVDSICLGILMLATTAVSISFYDLFQNSIRERLARIVTFVAFYYTRVVRY